MKVISVIGFGGGTGVTLTAAELALTAKAEGQSVLAVDTCHYPHLRRDIEKAGFHYLDDVRQLFRPQHEARWRLPEMPKYSLLCYPELKGHFLNIDLQDKKLVFTTVAGREPDAFQCLQQSIGWFSNHYDVMIVDVSPDKTMKQMFYDVSDEVHVMLRWEKSDSDWRNNIGRPECARSGPVIIKHTDRGRVPGNKDKWGRSVALQPYMDAAGVNAH